MRDRIAGGPARGHSVSMRLKCPLQLVLPILAPPAVKMAASTGAPFGFHPELAHRTKLCYISPVMKTCVAFGFYFWFSVPGGREANV
jgi:hypothetical protein